MYRPTASRRFGDAPSLFAIAATVMFGMAIPAAHALPIIVVGGGGVGVGGGGGGAAAGTPPLGLVSHSGTSSSEAKAGIHALDEETDSPGTSLDAAVSTSALSGPNVSGTGGGGLSASASTSDTMSTVDGKNRFTFRHFADFSPGAVADDASARGEISALWSLTFDVAIIDFTYSVSRSLLGAGAGTSVSSSLTVRNATTGTEILSLIDPATILDATLTIFGDIGDMLEIEVSGFSAYDVAGASSSIFNSLSYSLEFAEHAITVPEPLTTGLVIVGLLAMRRQRRSATLE